MSTSSTEVTVQGCHNCWGWILPPGLRCAACGRGADPLIKQPSREQIVRELLQIAQEWAAEPVPPEDRSDRLELALRRVLDVRSFEERPTNRVECDACPRLDGCLGTCMKAKRG